MHDRILMISLILTDLLIPTCTIKDALSPYCKHTLSLLHAGVKSSSWNSKHKMLCSIMFLVILFSHKKLKDYSAPCWGNNDDISVSFLTILRARLGYWSISGEMISEWMVYLLTQACSTWCKKVYWRDVESGSSTKVQRLCF